MKDSLEAALAAENATLESLSSGVELTLRQLEAVFERIRSARSTRRARSSTRTGTRRSAVASDKEPNTVVQVLQKGYLLHDRVLRPALVTVAKPKDA